MARYDKAEQLNLQAIQLIEKQVGNKHLQYVTALGNLAIVYHHAAYYEKAENIGVVA